MSRLLTIVVPTFNRREMLARAVRSVQAQRSRDFELLVVDNCSTDGSWELLGAQDWGELTVRLVRQEENLGAVGSAAKWKQWVSTPWATVLCDDDYLAPTFAGVVGSEIAAGGNGLVAVGYGVVNEDGQMIARTSGCAGEYSVESALESFFYRRLSLPGLSGFAIRREVLDSGDFPRFYPGGFYEDTFLCLRAMLSGGARRIAGIHYFRTEWTGSECRAQGATVNGTMAEAKFVADVRELFAAKGVGQPLLKLWTNRRWVRFIYKFLQEIVLNDLPFSEYRRLVHFTSKWDVARLPLILGVAPFFAGRWHPAKGAASWIVCQREGNRAAGPGSADLIRTANGGL